MQIIFWSNPLAWIHQIQLFEKYPVTQQETVRITPRAMITNDCFNLQTYLWCSLEHKVNLIVLTCDHYAGLCCIAGILTQLPAYTIDLSHLRVACSCKSHAVSGSVLTTTMSYMSSVHVSLCLIFAPHRINKENMMPHFSKHWSNKTR